MRGLAAIASMPVRLNNNNMLYKGWLIKIEYKYDNGKCDYQYYPPDNEPGYMAHYCTLEQVKAYIDERIED